MLYKFSHSNNSIVVGLDSSCGFFYDFGVSMLYSCVVIVFIFLLQPCYYSGIRVVVRLSGEREQDPSVNQASDVGDSHLRGRLLGNQVRVIMSHIV